MNSYRTISYIIFSCSISSRSRGVIQESFRRSEQGVTLASQRFLRFAIAACLGIPDIAERLHAAVKTLRGIPGYFVASRLEGRPRKIHSFLTSSSSIFAIRKERRSISANASPCRSGAAKPLGSLSVRIVRLRAQRIFSESSYPLLSLSRSLFSIAKRILSRFRFCKGELMKKTRNVEGHLDQ